MKYLTEDLSWVSFYPKFSTSLFVEKAGYFDERPVVHTSISQILVFLFLPFLVWYSDWFWTLLPFLFLGWGKLYISLPIRTGIQDCDSAAWGFNYHNNTIWIYIGGSGNFSGGRKWKTFTMPWHLVWVRTSTLLKNGTDWFNETPQKRVDWNSDKQGLIEGSRDWLDINKWKVEYPYVDAFDNTVVNATICVVEREWRPLFFKWTGLFSKKSKVIEVQFDKEVGKSKGCWKGGVMGVNYELNKNESPYDCLMRMQKERSF